MTIGQDNALATPAAGSAPTPNPFQRIIGVLFSPDATFASIARRPDWVAPLVLILVVSFAAGIIMAPHIDFGSAAREATRIPFASARTRMSTSGTTQSGRRAIEANVASGEISAPMMRWNEFGFGSAMGAGVAIALS